MKHYLRWSLVALLAAGLILAAGCGPQMFKERHSGRYVTESGIPEDVWEKCKAKCDSTDVNNECFRKCLIGWGYTPQ